MTKRRTLEGGKDLSHLTVSLSAPLATPAALGAAGPVRPLREGGAVLSIALLNLFIVPLTAVPTVPPGHTLPASLALAAAAGLCTGRPLAPVRPVRTGLAVTLLCGLTVSWALALSPPVPWQHALPYLGPGTATTSSTALGPVRPLCPDRTHLCATLHLADGVALTP